MLSLQINQHRVKWITSLRKRFVSPVHLLYVCIPLRAPRSTLRDYIDIRFGALENARVAKSDSADSFDTLLSDVQWREMLTFGTLPSRRFIVRELIMCSCCGDIMRPNAGRAGGNLQNLSHRRANERRWRDSGERIQAILLSAAIASW